MFEGTLKRILITLLLIALTPCVVASRSSQTAASSAKSASSAVGSGFSDIEKLADQGKFEEAIAALDELEKSDPSRKGLAHEYGAVYYRKADYIHAVDYLQKAIKENPSDDEAVQLLGLSLYLAGKPGDAIPYLEKVQSWYPKANVDAAYILGISYMQTKDYDHARAAFARMFGVGTDSAPAYLFTARMLLRFDFGPIAEQYGLKATQLDPKLPLAHELLGELYLYQSKIPEATKQLEAELAINPGSAVTYYKLADAYSRVQRYDDAERLLQRSIWLDATSTGPYILLGKVLEKKGETALAVRALQRALSMDPSNPISHHLLGQAYRDLGREEDAARELKLAEQLQTKQDASQP